MMAARPPSPPLRAASGPRRFESERLLVVDVAAHRFSDHAIVELPELLAAGDLVVVNDAATLPASLALTSHAAELRLLGRTGPAEFRVIAFGPGDHRTPTERRAPPPALPSGTRIAAGELSGTIVASEESRLLRVAFDRAGAELWAAIYRAARVVQYAYVPEPLELWDVQNRFAARPWSVEPPSAGRPLSFGLLTRLRARGVQVVGLTHAAGLSSSGAEALDRRLPLPEHNEIPPDTLVAIERSHAAGGRVVAVGTTVVRALEDRALEASARLRGQLRAGRGEATLRIGPRFRLRMVDALLTGLHEPTTSHFDLMQAFAPRRLLERATVHAAARGYLQHEFGDSLLIFRARERLAGDHAA